ncbi:MAG: L-2-amino-thiazoline-4-carboxylic acid hydrolase [Desulfarculaceae bacterium]|jgi:hypothetical protein
MTQTEISQLQRRSIEAAALNDVYQVLLERLGQEEALAIIEEALTRNAIAGGKDFAAQAPQEPSLTHFATILERWQQGGALDVEDVHLDDSTLSFKVTRCAYYDHYRSQGMPPELCRRLSCSRDFGFTTGYSPRLHLNRPTTLAQGSPACPFNYIWQEE